MEPVGVRDGYLEEEEDASHDDYSSVGGIREYDDIVSKTFVSEEAAYEFFNQYAKTKGFGIRRSDVRKDEEKRIIYRKFRCHRAGYRSDECNNLENRIRASQENNRCGCLVELTIKLNSKCDHWWVYNFVDKHNHDCHIDSVWSLRSHRGIDEGQKLEIAALQAAGASKSLIFQTLRAKAGSVKDLGFLKKDLYNYLEEQDRSLTLGDDADAIIRLFNQRKQSDPEFYFDYGVDEEMCLNRFFWADAQSIIDYSVFGDVLIFDSTYGLNRYKLAVVPFVGVNHHGSTTVFGCGFVSRETDESYKWLLSAFLKAMCQVTPNSVITDGDRAMCKAIRELLPSATHRICTWHMERNAKKYISDSHVWNKFSSLLSDTCSHETFERKWSAFEEVCSAREKTRDWLKHLYNTKELWGGAFVRNGMFLNMSTNQRSESLNSSLHSITHSYDSLRQAVQHFDRVITKIRMDEAILDGKSFRAQPNCTSLFRNLERHAGSIFTPYAFAKIQKELDKPKAKIKIDMMLELLKSMVSNVHQFAEKCSSDISLFEQKIMDDAWPEDAHKANSPTHEGCIFNELPKVDLTHSAPTETPKQVKKRHIYPGKGETENEANKVADEQEHLIEVETPDKIFQTKSGSVLKQPWMTSEFSPFLDGNDSRKRQKTTKSVGAQAQPLQTLNAIEIAAMRYVRNNMPNNRELVRIRSCNIFDDGCYDEDVAYVDFITLTARQMVSLTVEDKANNINNWLIDDIINCYMMIMSDGKNKRPHIHMIDTLVVSWLKEHGNAYWQDFKTDNTWQRIARAGEIYRPCEMIFFPINRANAHWYTGVLNFRRKEFQILDSMKGKGDPMEYEAETKDLLYGIQTCLGSNFQGKRWEGELHNILRWPIRIIDNIPKQDDGTSCGLFCLKYMQLWDGDNIKIPFSQADVDLFRNKLAAELLFSELNVIEEVQRARDDIIRLSKEN